MTVDFDGINDVINLASPAGLDNVWAGGATLMAWVHLDSFGEASQGRVASKATNIASAGGWGFFPDGAGAVDRLRFVHDWTTTDGDWVTPDSSLTLAAWHHIAVSYNKDAAANDPAFAIDGVAQAVTELSAPAGSAASDAAQIFTLANLSPATTSRSLEGRMADMRLYNRILPIREIASIHSARGVDGIVEGLIARWPMNDGAQGTPGSLYAQSSTAVVAAALSIVVEVVGPGQPPVQDGDELVLLVASSGDSSGTPENITTPAGWTHRNAGNTDLPATISTPSIWIFTRTAASEPASYTVTGNQTTTKLGSILIFRGATGFDVASTINTGTSTLPVSPGVTAGADAIVIHVLCADNNDITPNSSDTYPPNINGRKAFEAIGTGNGVSMGAATEMRASGATGTATWTLQASEQWGCLSLTLLGGGGAVSSYLKDVGPNQFPSIIQSGPRLFPGALKHRRVLIGG